MTKRRTEVWKKYEHSCVPVTGRSNEILRRGEERNIQMYRIGTHSRSIHTILFDL